MSLEAITWAYRTTVGSPTRKAVLLVLANYADQDDSAYPSRQRIAKMTELGLTAVKDALRDLKDMGVIRETEERFRTDGSHTSNRYYLDLSWEPEGGREATHPPSQATHLGREATHLGREATPGLTPSSTGTDTNTPVALRATPSGRATRPSRRLRAVADTGEDQERTGSLPDDAPADEKPPAPEPRRLSMVVVVDRFAKDALAASIPRGQRDTQKGALGTWVKKQREQGILLEEIAEAARIFFLDPRGYVAGDEPLWKAFINRFPTLHARATEAVARVQREAVDHTDYKKEQETWVRASEL